MADRPNCIRMRAAPPDLARQGPHNAAHYSMRAAARLSEIDPRDRRNLVNQARDRMRESFRQSLAGAG